MADFRADRCDRLRVRYPTIHSFATADELIGSDVQAVVIATPLAHHFPIALRALQAGKHVLIEKPFTSTAAEAQILIDEAAKRKLTLLVDHTFVYNPAVSKLRDLITSGELGELLYFDSQRINLGLFQSDSDVVWDLAVHDLAILHHLTGDIPVSVAAVGAVHLEGHPVNTAFITMQYARRFIAHVNVNWLSPVKVRQLIVGGSKRMVIYDDLGPGNKIRVYDCGAEGLAADDPDYRRRVDYRFGDMWAPHVDPAEPLGRLATHFVACIEKRAEPLSGGDAGLHVVRLLEAAKASIEKSGTPVPFATE